MELNLRKEAEKPRPRLKPINRQQLVMRPMDVEQLVLEGHEVRAIWEFVGRLDLSQYYEDIGVIEGEAGRPAFETLKSGSLDRGESSGGTEEAILRVSGHWFIDQMCRFKFSPERPPRSWDYYPSP